MAKTRTSRKKAEQPTPEQAEAAAVAVVQDAQEHPEKYDAQIENADFDPTKFEKEAAALPKLTPEELAKPVPDREESAHLAAPTGDLLPSGNGEAPSTAVENAAVARQVVEELAAHTALPDDRKPRTAIPNPFSQEKDYAAGMALLEDRQARTMLIKFDAKPDQKHTETLKNQGYRWNAPQKAWAKAIDRDAGWKTRVDAERLFREIAAEVRQEKGEGHAR